ncbi:MAG: oligosaccharide flippase family protein [Acidobacteriota bacterium]|nr:oligosaccharide flippase family protein [Blastocatellia bacterium]MDW8412474.1 oligosaccharide flippase family protein [Acidobacteriota bacterium]
MNNEESLRLAGRGTLFITISKAYFIFSGYCIYLVLSRVLTPEQFGIYGVVTGIVSIINAIVVVGTQQTVSKFVSEDDKRAEAVKDKALKLQLVIGGTIALGYFVSQPLIAKLENDPDLLPYLRISTLITAAYSFYAVYLGYLNGQRKFFRQSGLDVTYSTLKLGLICTLAFFLKSTAAAILGFGLAATVALGVSPIFAAGRGSVEKEKTSFLKTADYLRFQFALLGSVLVSNCLQKADLLLLKALGSDFTDEANRMAGYYTALMAVANVTYQSVVSVAFVIFPMISRASFEDKKEDVATYVTQTVKYSLMIMALVATVLSSNSRSVLRLVFGESYLVGAPALSVATYGAMCYGILYILSAIISSSGKPKISFAINSITLAISCFVNFLLIPKLQLLGASVGTTVAMFCGLILAGVYVYTKFSSLVSPTSIFRISLATTVTYAIGKFIAADELYLVVGAVLIQITLYLVVLLILKEVGRDELLAVTVIFGRSTR